MNEPQIDLPKEFSRTRLPHRFLALSLFCWLGLSNSSFSLYSQDTVELDNIKKISLSIRRDNVIVFSFKEAPPVIIPPRTYKKSISHGSDLFLVSYGLGIKAQPTLSLQLKSSANPPLLIEFSQKTISISPGASITLTIDPATENTTLTPSLMGSIKIDEHLIEPGMPVSLGAQKFTPSPLPPKTPATQVSPKPLKSKPNSSPTPSPAPDPKSESNPQQTPAITQNSAPTSPRPPTTIKSIERRKILIEALRETSKTQTPSLTARKNEPPVREITVQQNPDEEQSLIREGRILLQLSTGLQNILDQITNNPLTADETFKEALPPLPPPANKPPQTSFNEWIARLQSENIALRKKTLKTREQLTQFINSLNKPSYRLSPLIPESIEEEARLASKAYKNQNWSDAVLHYKKALEVEPFSLHLLSNLGVVYFSQGNYEEAEKILLQTVQQAPHDSFSYSILGICYLQKDQLEKAIDALLISVNMNPLDAQSQNYLAMAMTKKQWLTAAEEHARESIRLNPNYSEAHYNLAQIYINQKPMARELAKKHYNLSVNLEGPRDEALETLLQIEAPKAAAPSTEPQIQVNPSNP